MLAASLLASLVAALVATAALFVPVTSATHLAGRLQWTSRLVGALVGTALLVAVTAVALQSIDVTRRNTTVACAVLVVASLVWLPATRQWSARGHVCWAMSMLLFVVYLAFMIQWTIDSQLGVTGTIGGFVLWLFELAGAVLAAAYLWELCDALGRQRWRRRIRDGAPDPVAPDVAHLPFVSLHVPAHNEPPEMVIDTVRSLLALDYPHFEIVVIDDNTEDEETWRPVERWCAEHGVKFAHLADWPGYKSGALNYALASLIDPRAELIGIIDSDYQLDPAFLRRCAPLFADPKVGFLQTPQDYRDWDVAPFYRRLYYSYKYFFAVSQPSRNERDGAIFAGTMGLIRRSALVSVGGWDEWCITEDAELSLRLLREGWSGLHVERSFGKGIMPLTFEALKSQRFRWCFGGIQILRKHWRWMMPGRVSPNNEMRLRQRWAYLSGAFQWYGDLLGLLFYIFLLAGALNIALGGGLLFRKLSGFLVAFIPLMAVLGLVRAAALLRRGTRASWREAIGAFMIWQSTSLVVARASVQALFAKEAEFLRTPKTTEGARTIDALRGNLGETLLAVLGIAGIVASLAHTRGLSGPLTAALLLWPTVAFASAPLNSLAALRAALPSDLAARRRTENRRMPVTRTVTAAAAGVGVIGAAAAATLVLIGPANAPGGSPSVLNPAQGKKKSTVQTVVDRTPASSSVPSSTVPSSHRPSGASTSAPAGTAPTTVVASPSPSVSAGTPVTTDSPSPSVLPTSDAAPSTTAAPSSSAPASDTPSATPTP